MIALFEGGDVAPDIKTLNIIFTDNSLLQSIQLSVRIDNDHRFDKYKHGEGLTEVISSASKEKSSDAIPRLVDDGYRNFIMCSNKRRVSDIHRRLITNPRHPYRYNVWVDEADRNYNMFKAFLALWEALPSVLNLTLVTATPARLLRGIGTIKIVKIESTYDAATYHRFSDSDFIIYAPLAGDYIDAVFAGNRGMLAPATVWYVPSPNVKKARHLEVMRQCLANGLNCIIINGDGIALYTGDTSEIIEGGGGAISPPSSSTSTACVTSRGNPSP